MLEPLFFALGIASNLIRIIIYLILINYPALHRKIRWVYFLLAIPAVYAIFLVQHEQKAQQYTIFLGIFLAYLVFKALRSWIWKIPFQEKMGWKLRAPYFALYFSMQYGFVVMVWRYDSVINGIFMLALIVIQTIMGLWHKPSPPEIDDDLFWVFPPDTMVDPRPWNRYWYSRIKSGHAGLVHSFCHDGNLVDAMRANGLKTVLCVGNGISQEPRALARAGFDVTALDLSPFATEFASTATPSEEVLANLIDGRPVDEYGQLKFVTGDLCDTTLCPGPYDVVIERKTLQNFQDEEHRIAMEAVANRLASRGIFFSHCHNPYYDPKSHTWFNWNKFWFVKEGWQIWRGETPLEGRVAWLFISTG